MYFQSLVTVVLAGWTFASPIALLTPSRGLDELRNDTSINALLTPAQIGTLIDNRHRIAVAADSDGTLVTANGIIAERTLDSMRALDVTIITANSEERIMRASHGYHNIIFEQNAGSRFNNKTTYNLTPEEVADVGPFIEQAKEMMKANGFTAPQWTFIPKLAGYAIVMTDHSNNPVDNETWDWVHRWMIAQSTNGTNTFKVQPTTGAFDLTLARLNKADSFTDLKFWKGPRDFWIVMGDTEETDGPMVALADMGISVHRKFGDYIHFPDVMDSTTLFEWIHEVQIAPEF